MVPVPVSCRIPAILSSIGRNQSWLADMTGLSRHRISDYASMRRVMSYQTAYMIAQRLDVYMEELYQWEWQRE
jgi:transcriptional regulator with XRE-family HTH domain